MDERQARALRQALDMLRAEHPEMTSHDYDAVLGAIDGLNTADVEDIIFPWRCVMYALGYEYLTESVVKVDVVVVPPAIMIGFGTTSKMGFDPGQLSDEEHYAIGRGIVAVLQAAGWPVDVNDDGEIEFDHDKLGELVGQFDPWQETIKQFRQELDTLYPDKPSTQDPLSKWLNPEEDS